MYSMTRFSGLIKHLPKASFKKIVDSSKADRYAKKIKAWDILTTMIYGQITQAKSLRTLTEGFNSHHNNHFHLNTRSVKRSTFSDALANRSVEPFKQLCELLIEQASGKIKKQCQHMVSIIDSTPIMLQGHGFDWAKENRTRRTMGLKLHLELDTQHNTPVYANITQANVNDITDAKNNITPQANTTYVIDKGYCDFNWWYKINQARALFVTRIKTNTALKVCCEQNVPSEFKWLIKHDQIIHLTNKHPRSKTTNHYAHKDLRLVTIYREGKKPMAIVTNDFERSAKEIADLYKQRWQIELFFKWIKQKLKLKTYFGRSKNAVCIQIYCALITYLIMQMMKNRLGRWQSMLSIQTWLQHGLFVRDAINRHYYQRFKDKRKLINKVQMELPL